MDGDDIDNSSSIDDGGSDECCSDDGTFDNKSHNDCDIDDNDSDDRWSDDGFVVPGVCITPLMDDDNGMFIDDGWFDNDDVKDDNEVIDDDGVDNDDCSDRSCTDGNEAGWMFNEDACVDDCGVIFFDDNGPDDNSFSNDGVGDDVESYNDGSDGKDDIDVIVFDSVMETLS